jgi:MT0933-like antitoxin protein
MVDFGKLAKKAKGLADTQGDKISSAVSKSTDFVDKKTKGKYSDKLEKVDEAAKKLDKRAPGPSTDVRDVDAPPREGSTGREPDAGTTGL